MRNRTTGQIVWDPGTNWSTVWGAFKPRAVRQLVVGWFFEMVQQQL